MTYYHGGKKRIGDQIASIIYDISSTFEHIKGYVEPFCGMCGVYQHIPELFQDQKMTYKAGDINNSVVMMWNNAKKGWIPPIECTKDTFFRLRGNGESSAEKGFLGHARAFRNKYFSTYNYRTNLKHQSTSVVTLSEKLKNVKFKHGDYNQFSNLKNYIIYCDPPYITNSFYPNEHHEYVDFNHDLFYKWIETMSIHNLVFISEKCKLPYKCVGKFKDDEKLYFV